MWTPYLCIRNPRRHNVRLERLRPRSQSINELGRIGQQRSDANRWQLVLLRRKQDHQVVVDAIAKVQWTATIKTSQLVATTTRRPTIT